MFTHGLICGEFLGDSTCMSLFTEGLVLGLSTGIFCMGYCAPVILPYLHARDRPGWKGKALPVLIFAIGRLVAYMAFGTLLGWLGAYLTGPESRIGLTIAFLLLSLILMSYGLSLNWPRFNLCQRLVRFSETRYFPLLLGIFTGLNVCPPFLLAADRALQHGHPWEGMWLFLAFYFGTIIYLAPFVFTQLLSRMEWVRSLAQMVALGTGVAFTIMALVQLITLL